MRNFCTLFDSFYLSRALVMYNSLLKTKFEFHLFIFAFDQLAYDILIKLKLERVTVISLAEFEDEKLLSVKQERTKAEYCWTSTPSIIHYSIKKFGLNDCTYIDADLYFYDSPEILFEEMPDDSPALITEHRYSKIAEFYEGKRAGRFCVQFLTIKNTIEGLDILETWRNQCIDWCYNRYEDGKFGDQKYLDNWPEKYPKAHILNHLGGGVAPWNIQQYKFFLDGGALTGKEKKSKKEFKLIFYHFHFVKFVYNGFVDIGWHPLSKYAIRNIYKQYIHEIIETEKMLENLELNYKTILSTFSNKFSFFGLVKSFLKKIIRFNYIKIS